MGRRRRIHSCRISSVAMAFSCSSMCLEILSCAPNAVRDVHHASGVMHLCWSRSLSVGWSRCNVDWAGLLAPLDFRDGRVLGRRTSKGIVSSSSPAGCVGWREMRGIILGNARGDAFGWGSRCYLSPPWPYVHHKVFLVTFTRHIQRISITCRSSHNSRKKLMIVVGSTAHTLAAQGLWLYALPSSLAVP
jgi:hypothetical protein